jgi:hypothetical protein
LDDLIDFIIRTWGRAVKKEDSARAADDLEAGSYGSYGSPIYGPTTISIVYEPFSNHYYIYILG